MMTDPIGDMLTRIRNANQIKAQFVDIPSSKMKVAIAEILKREGYITDYQKIEDNLQGILRVEMKYSSKGEPVIHHLQRVSKPSRRKYMKVGDIDLTCGGLGISIMTTSYGLMTGRDAKKKNCGGEVVCEIW